jgi:hypothetical protein
MNLQEMLQEVQIILGAREGKLVSYGEFHSAVLGVIRRINSEVEKENELVHIYSVTSGQDNIEDLIVYDIPDEPGNIGDPKEYSQLEFDSVNNCITMPATWTKLLAVYRSNTKLRPVPYDILRYNNYDDCYTNINRNLYFNIDVTSESFDIWLKIRRDYEVPARMATSYTGMPQNAYQLVMVGIILSLLQRPKYFDRDLINIYNPMFDKLMKDLSMVNMTRGKNAQEKPNWTFNPMIDTVSDDGDIQI